jgi:arginyl-tRNA synthetase
MFHLKNIIKQQPKQKILVDFSSPNIAKDMHVGHLRSTIIGDSVCKIFEILGHEVHRVNHIGDFGLQFGMIIEYLFEKFPDFSNCDFSIADLQKFYAESKKRFDSDPVFSKAAYNKVVLLQNNDQKIVDAWNFIKDISRKSYDDIYDKLDIKLTEVGESFYQNQIPSLLDELALKNLLVDDNGRKVINIPGYKLPLTVIKTDGGFTYDTTDLAAIRYRLMDLDMDQVYYIVDIGQSLHFELIFKVAEMAGWKKSHQIVKHIEFGVVCGDDGKKFKSRDGDTVKLNDLLNEAINKSTQVLRELSEGKDELEPNEKQLIIKNVAYGSLKYGDLSTVRTNDYKFSYDKMLSLKGNTGAYQLYQYVRICAIMRNVNEFLPNVSNNLQQFKVTNQEEINVCKLILQLPDVINRVSDNLMFNTLCSYLYDLTVALGKCYKWRCIEYQDKKIVDINYNRIMICLMAKSVIEVCFNILGIKKLDRM